MGKVAIVTGSARGIGAAIALRLAQDGYDVCINDVPQNKGLAEGVVQEIQKLGRKAVVAIADVTDISQVQEMVQTCVKELGDLNTMVANAGIAQVQALLDVSAEDFQRMLSVNITGVHNCYSTAAKQMIKQGNLNKDNPGKLIAAASIVGFKAFALLGHYSATKWAVRGLNQAYAMELAEHHITCNAYAPGIVDTPMWDLIDSELGKKQGKAKGEVMNHYVKELTALGRPSEGVDVARLVSFLGSKDSDFVTGQTMLVDGGIVYT